MTSFHLQLCVAVPYKENQIIKQRQRKTKSTAVGKPTSHCNMALGTDEKKEKGLCYLNSHLLSMHLQGDWISMQSSRGANES